MSGYEFSSGHIVVVAQDSLSGPPTVADFVVVRRYPVATGQDVYWIRGLAGPGQRMVMACDLGSAMPPSAGVSRFPSVNSGLAVPTDSIAVAV